MFQNIDILIMRDMYKMQICVIQVHHYLIWRPYTVYAIIFAYSYFRGFGQVQ